MVKRTRARLFFLVGLLALAPLHAHGTSLYSMNLLGERMEAGDTRSIGLGGSTQMVRDSLGVLLHNPALLVNCRKVTVGATSYIATDEGRSQDFTERDISVRFPSFRLAFPIGRLVTLAVGYIGRYDPDGSFEVPLETSGKDSYVQRYIRSGGLYALPVTASLGLLRHLSLGFTVSVERGFVEERWDIDFDDPFILPGAGFKKSSVSGLGYGAGIVLFPGGPLMIGGTFESAVDYDVDVLWRFTQSGLDSLSAETMRLPARVSAGVTWEASRSLTFLASGFWSDFTEFDGLAFPTDRLDTQWGIVFGMEFPRGILIKRSRLPIRLGFSYEQIPYQFPVEQSVHKWLASVGAGLGVGERAKIDIALQGGVVGSIETNTLEDRLFRIYMSVSGSEVWKRKRERQY